MGGRASHRRPTLRQVGVLLALAVLGSPALGAPAGAADSTEFAHARFDRSGWASITYYSDGEDTEFTLVTEGAHFPHAQGMILYNTERRAFAWSTLGTADPGVGVLVSARVDDRRSIRIEQYWESETRGHWTAIQPVRGPPGVYHVVFLAPGALDAWELTATGGPGARLLGMEAGEGAFHHRIRDFRGDALARASAYGYPGAAVAANASLTRTAGDALVAAYFMVPWLGHSLAGTPWMRMAAETPRGEVTCPCYFSDLTGSNSLGTHPTRFTVQGVQTEVVGMGSTIILYGADVRLPNIEHSVSTATVEPLVNE